MKHILYLFAIIPLFFSFGCINYLCPGEEPHELTRVRFINHVTLDDQPCLIRNIRVHNTVWSNTLDYGDRSIFKAVSVKSINNITFEVWYKNQWKIIEHRVNNMLVSGADNIIDLQYSNAGVKTKIMFTNNIKVNGRGVTIRSIEAFGLIWNETLAPNTSSASREIPVATDTFTIVCDFQQADGTWKTIAFQQHDNIITNTLNTVVLGYTEQNIRVGFINSVTVDGIAVSIRQIQAFGLTWSGSLAFGDTSIGAVIPNLVTSYTVTFDVRLPNGIWKTFSEKRSDIIKENQLNIIDLVYDKNALVQIENGMTFNGNTHTIRNIEIVELGLVWNKQLAYGAVTSPQNVLANPSHLNITFELQLDNDTWIPLTSTMVNPTIPGSITTILLTFDNTDITTLEITNNVTIQNQACQIRDIRCGKYFWHEVIPFNGTSQTLIIEPMAAPITIEGYFKDPLYGGWHEYTWILEDSISNGEQVEIILEGEFPLFGYSNFVNQFKEELVGGNYLYYDIRNINIPQLSTSLGNEIIPYADTSSTITVGTGYFDSLIVEGEVKPIGSGNWVSGYWIFYDVTIDPFVTLTFDLVLEEKFRKAKFSPYRRTMKTITPFTYSGKCTLKIKEKTNN